MGRLSQSPRALLTSIGVAAAIIAGGATAALAGGSTIRAEAAAAGEAVTCSQGSLRNLQPNESTTFTCHIPGGLVGHAFELFARVGVFNAGTNVNTAETNCSLSDAGHVNSGGDSSPGRGGVALQLAVRSTGASFSVECSTRRGTGAQVTGTRLTGIAVSSLTTETL